MKEKIIAVTSVITALTALWAALSAFIDKLPLNISDFLKSNASSGLGGDVRVLSLICGLVLLTMYLQWDAVRSRVVPKLEAISHGFDGLVSFFNLALLLVSIFILHNVVSISDQQASFLNRTATLYLDDFPGNTQFIRGLLDEMKSPSDELVVILDYPSYGSYSALSNYVEIEQSLRTAAVGFSAKIRMCYYSAALAREDLDGFTLLSQVNTPRFNEWKQHFFPNKTFDDDADFHDSLLEVDVKLIRLLEGGPNFVGKSNLSSPPPVFLWLLNNNKAVFSFPGENETFETVDARLIGAFTRYSSQYCPKEA